MLPALIGKSDLAAVGHLAMDKRIPNAGSHQVECSVSVFVRESVEHLNDVELSLASKSVGRLCLPQDCDRLGVHVSGDGCPSFPRPRSLFILPGDARDVPDRLPEDGEHHVGAMGTWYKSGDHVVQARTNVVKEVSRDQGKVGIWFGGEVDEPFGMIAVALLPFQNFVRIAIGEGLQDRFHLD
jgi:hypothetical protein